MEITTQANQLQGKISQKELEELELFFSNTNLSNEKRQYLISIIENIIENNK